MSVQRRTRIVLLLSLFRGLHRCVRDLRTDLRGEPY